MNKFFKRLALLLAVLMIVSMMPVQLFADNSVTGEEQSNGTGEASGNSNAVAKIGDTGYETLAEAIAAANGNGTVTLLTATTELIQALLDGQYGSIDGLTIELPAGDYGKLELGRATKYAGSKTEYFVGGFDSTATNYKAFTNADEIREYKGQSTWTPNCFYRRALNNVTIKAADNATVTIEKISADAGQIYGKADAPKYDYVLDVEIPDTNKSYWMALAWNNVTFEGINFKSSVNIESSSEKTLIDGLHFENCKFNSGYTALAAANDPNKASKGMGIRFVSWTKTTNNLRDLTVNNCTFEDCSEGVYTNPVYGVSVTNSSFNNINHNAVAIQDVGSAVNHGNVVISGNTFTNVSDRIIRFNNAGEDTTITITGNTSVNSGDSAGEIIKATTMPDSVNINMASNTWGDVNGKTAVLSNGFNKVVVATVNGKGYATLAEAIANANPDANGVITYEIYGKATVDSTGWIQVARAGLTGLTKVEFVGKTPDAEICITNSTSVLADQLYDIDVSFTALVLSHPNGAWVDDLGHATNYFACLLRNTNAAENTVTYTNCTFPNGLCNNQYGKTVVDDCKFTNATSGKYNLWNYGGNTEIKNSTFTGTRGIKAYSERTDGGAIKVSNTTFDGLTEKAAIVASKATDITLDNVSATDCGKGFFQKDIEGSSKDEKITITANGSAISGTFNITADKTTAAAKEEFNISAGTFTSEVSSDYLADGFELKKNSDDTYGVAAKNYVAAIGDAYYSTLQEAIDAAKRNNTVKLLADTRENVTIDKQLTLDLNGFTLNGGTEKGKPALTVTARVTVKDSSTAQTGTIMREDTAENSGVSSHYVIDIQGSGWLTFESGIVKNNSGTAAGKGASLVRVGDDSVAKFPGLNIKGGTFTQDNFIVIKVDRGDLFLNGGTLNSTDSYAVENWLRATIKGGTVNGAVSSWTYSDGSNSTLTISGGTINGNVESVSYDGSVGKKAKVSITGGTVNGTLIAGIYNSATEPTKDMATIEVTGGTFTKDPTKYVIEDSAITKNADGTFGVAKAYLAKVGDTSYYTMDEAFKAQTASGEPIVLLRDYTTGSPFKSGSINRTVNLSGFTWTCTGTDANSAAFEINYSDVTLTVKNGKVISSQLVGLIPSAMGGTIKYDNSGLVFESVEMSTTATSGIETNGNNTNDTVTLKDSTLNVPNGFGIYFPSSGTLTLDNSTVNAKTMGVQVCAGNLSINEGSAVTVTGDAVPKAENDGAIQDGAAISIVNRTGYKGLGTVTVSGGKFTAKEGNSAIKAYNWANNTESDFTASEKVAVSGGTFSSEVSEDLCAEGSIPTKNADGTYGVKAGKYVAQIGSTKYETLEEAVAAANAGDTVKLLDDVDLTETLIIRDKTITLDLNGKTISNSTDIWNESTYSWSLISVRDNGDLTIDDTVGGGTLKAKENDCFTLDVYAHDTKNVENTRLTVNAGNYIGNISAVYAFTGKVMINGGHFSIQQKESGSDPYRLTLNCYDSSYTAGRAGFTVNGGTFENFDPRNNLAEGAGTSFVAEGVGINKDENGNFTAVPNMAAQIVDAKGASVKAFATLADALAAANAGDTVTLLADVTADVVINKNITLDLGGKTLTNTGAGKATLTVAKGATATVKNGSIVGGTGNYNIAVGTKDVRGGTLTLENVTATAGNTGSSMIDNCGTLTITSGTYTGGLNVVKSEEGSTLVISGGKFTLEYATNGYTGVIFAYGTTTITGGEFIQNLTTTGRWNHPQVILAGVVEGYTSSVTVTGGIFTNKMSGESIFRGVGKATSDNFEVSGGTFNKYVNDSYFKDGYIPVKNADGTYGVKEGKYVAQIGSTKYETLADAIRLATKGKTITLLADINTPEKTYEITKNLTIDLNGKTVTGSGYDGVFEVTGKNIEVVLNATNGGKVIAVENSGSAGKYAMAVWMCGAGSTLKINGGEFIQNITSTDDKQMDMIYASAGTIIINSGSFTSGTPKWTLNIKDSAYKDGTANIIVNGGTFTDYDPRNAENEGKGTSLVADGVGIDKNADGTFTAKSGMAAQIVDADGNSVAAYAGHYDAIAAAKDGETVILLSDRKNFVTNTVNANITIDLNGKTLSLGNNNPFFLTNGEVTIQNGTIDTKSTYACVIVNAYNKLTLKNVKITGVTGDNGKNLVNVCSNAEVTIDKDTVLTASGSNGAAVFIGQDVDAKYTLNVYGKVIQESKSFAISGNGSYKGTTTINIYDGAEVKSASVAIYHPQAGVINVNGGLVEGYCAIGIKSGTLNINGGTVRGTADDHVLDDSNSTSGTITYDGSAIIVDSRSTGYAGNVNINVTGGTVESYYSTAIREIGEQDKTDMTQLTKLNVTGGSVLGASKNPVNVTSDMLVRDISVINISVSGGTFKHAVPEEYCADRYIPTQNEDGTYGVQKAMKGSEKNPYTLKELGAMTRAQYIAAQEALGGTMYVEIGDYSYDKNGVLGNGVRNDTPGQTPDHSKLNAYGENGYLGEKNDGANGKNIIFVGGSITSGVTGYASIDNIGTSLLLAVPAYTNVTFEGVTFKNVMSFNYQLYTSPWSQLGELKFSGCTFNGIIVGAIAAQTLTFDGCEFTNYTNKDSENNSNPTWIRPAYGNWTKGDNEGQGANFKSLTTINFINNKVTSTRPVKFERIAQWEMDTKVTVKNNEVTISAQEGDTSTKSVGFYFGANAKFDLTLDGNKKLGDTSALYTAVYSAPNEKTYAGLPAGSTVKDSNGADVEVAGVIWKTTDALTLKTTTEAVEVAGVKFATLEEAYAAAKNGDTITLLADVELSSAIEIQKGKTITLDLNGKKLSTTTKTGDATRHYYAIDNYGTFTLRDSSAEQSGEIRARGIENLGTGTMTIESGKIVAIDANGGAAIWNNANLTINGGTFVAEYEGTSNDPYGPGCVYNNGTLMINGGTFMSANKRTYAIVSKAGTVTITPADGKNVTISGAHGGLGIDGGTAIINGGSYASSDYYGLYVSNDAGTADVTVNGGTFTGKKYSVLIGSDGSSSVTSTLKIKGGTFDMPIHAQENTIDGAIAISGGKFKFKVDDKYFDGDHACSTDTTDGYYTVAGHPIISAGLTISADMSFRVKVRSGYENGSLRYYYDTIGENNTIVRVEGEGILGATDAEGNSIFRIYNVNPQRADLVYTFQYYDAEGNAVGTPKQRSVIAYFEDFYNLPLGDNEDLDAKKTFIANFLEYCASAMERSYDLHKDVTLNGKTWQGRADAVREMMTRLGLVAADYEFKGNLGRYYSDNVNGVIIERGVAFGSTFKVYYAFSKATIDNGYRVFRQGMDVTDKLELVDGAYRLYFELAPYEFKDNLTITVNNGTTKVCEYTSPLANTLEVLSKSADASVSKMAKAAFNYFVALQNYNG